MEKIDKGNSRFIRTSGLKDTQMEQLSKCFEILGIDFDVEVGGRMNIITFGGCAKKETGFANGNPIDAFFDENGIFFHMVVR